MGMADIAEVLWNGFMRHNPQNPDWPNRDRFVLSNGHGSMLIYSLLHLTGYELPMEELKNFRQLHSKTPGHPEYGYAPGVETTTGPLGQGISNAVGMAIAEKALAAQFNRGDHEIIDHFTYTFVGDGCLMEGISHEVCSLAGTLGLGKLIVYYDDNGISIDGDVAGWFSDDTPKRFEAYGWQVIAGVDGHDPAAIKAGAPLGADEIAATRAAIGWEHPAFVIPDDIYAGWDAKAAGAEHEASWSAMMDAYRAEYPDLAAELIRRLSGELPDDFAANAQAYIEQCQAKGETIASRKASQNAINALGPMLGEFMGGSADLAGSNLTLWSGSQGLTADDAAGNYIYYGVREFGMSAIMNGIALHGGFIPYGATFLIFMEYARNAVRMAALMRQRCIFVYTHDSIGLGEDGPTHQPVEQLTALRATPGLNTWRPCDAVESAVCWKSAIERHDGPSALVFSRQGLPHQERSAEQLANIARGAYVLRDCAGAPEAIIIATGSEVGLAMQAAEALADRAIRVVSMPCPEVFEQQDAGYRESVLPSDCLARVAVEAAHVDYWHKYVGLDGRIVGMSTFGESAPANELFEQFGFTVDNVAAVVSEVMEAI
jgi:transketolase